MTNRKSAINGWGQCVSSLCHPFLVGCLVIDRDCLSLSSRVVLPCLLCKSNIHQYDEKVLVYLDKPLLLIGIRGRAWHKTNKEKGESGGGEG